MVFFRDFVTKRTSVDVCLCLYGFVVLQEQLCDFDVDIHLVLWLQHSEKT